MKQIFAISFYSLFIIFIACNSKTEEDKSKRPSPPVSVSAVLVSGTEVKIDYGQPSLKSRVVGLSIEPMNNKIWRAGANEATTFDFSKNVQINGQALPAGKYAFFVWQKDSTATLIFNKLWDTWGAYDYEKNKSEDALKVDVPVLNDSESAEKLVYSIDNSGNTILHWGTWKIAFTIL